MALIGHVNQYERRRRHEKQVLKQEEPGAAVIEYKDKEQDLVGLTWERFWGYLQLEI